MLIPARVSCCCPTWAAGSYLDELSNATVERLYGDALGALATLQARIPEDAGLPAYDEALLMSEMELFREWLLGKHLGMDLSAAQQQYAGGCIRQAGR